MDQQLIKDNTSYFEIKKSQFYGYVFKVTSINEVTNYLNVIRNQHPKATHVCFAYIIHHDGVFAKYDDDNEPSKTSGYAIYNLLMQLHLINVLAVSVRYYGHIKLGANGLIHAYSNSIKLCCENNIEPYHEQYEYVLEFAYHFQKDVNHWLSNEHAIITNKKFLANCIIYEINCDHLLANHDFLMKLTLKNK